MPTIWIWYAARSRREQLLLLLMVIVAVPILSWLLVVQPLSASYDRALQRHLEAVDRHGRVLALAGRPRTTVAPRGAAATDLQQSITDLAVRGGVKLDRVEAVSPTELNLTGSAPTTVVLLRWFQQIEQQGVSVTQVTLTPAAGGGGVGVTTRLVGP